VCGVCCVLCVRCAITNTNVAFFLSFPLLSSPFLSFHFEKVFLNITRAAPDSTLDFVAGTLGAALTEAKQWQPGGPSGGGGGGGGGAGGGAGGPVEGYQAFEAALYLLYFFGEACPKPKPPTHAKLYELVEWIHTNAQLTAHGPQHILMHEAVVMMYHDCACRFYRPLQLNTDLIPVVLEALLGEAGLYHASPRVRSRVCFQLRGVGKSLHQQLAPFVEQIVESFQALLPIKVKWFILYIIMV